MVPQAGVGQWRKGLNTVARIAFGKSTVIRLLFSYPCHPVEVCRRLLRGWAEGDGGRRGRRTVAAGSAAAAAARRRHLEECL